ncbi:MAG: lipoprotein [Burkholderiaceae bacterium]|nr:lipoprotein [Burkholderiaceae bacterium]
MQLRSSVATAPGPCRRPGWRAVAAPLAAMALALLAGCGQKGALYLPAPPAPAAAASAAAPPATPAANPR